MPGRENKLNYFGEIKKRTQRRRKATPRFNITFEVTKGG